LEVAIQHLTTLIQEAAWLSTPERKKAIQETNNIPLQVKELVYKKKQRPTQVANTEVHSTKLT
jgi:hypothetical protein